MATTATVRNVSANKCEWHIMSEQKLHAITCSSPDCNNILSYVLQYPSAYRGHEMLCWNCTSDFCDVTSLLQLWDSTSQLPTRNDLAIAQNEQEQMQQRLGIIQYFQARLEKLISKMPIRNAAQQQEK